MAALELQGHTVVLVAVRGALAGMLAVSDTLKPNPNPDPDPDPNPDPNLTLTLTLTLT